MDNKQYKDFLINKLYKFSLSIMKLIDTFSRNDFSLVIIAKQLLRSATSIGANIVEGQASSSKKDFTNFISYSLKSANETKYWLGYLEIVVKQIKKRLKSYFPKPKNWLIY